MGLLHDESYLSAIKLELARTQHTLIAFTAYIKLKALEEVAKSISDDVEVTIVVRWNKIDLLSGASDLEIFPFCFARGWKLRIASTLHGKLYLFDSSSIILGSSNLTGRGLGLVKDGNLEFGTSIDATAVDSQKLQSLANNAREVDEELYRLLQADIESGYEGAERVEWSDAVLKELNETISYLWVEDCLFLAPGELVNLNLNDERHRHDFELLRLDLDRLSHENMRAEFLSSRIGRWLIGVVKENDGINFGGLTARLHNSLLNDPKPYRRDVKSLVATLIEWVKLCPETFSTTQYRRTITVTLV